jgi:hypothetical protein
MTTFIVQRMLRLPVLRDESDWVAREGVDSWWDMAGFLSSRQSICLRAPRREGEFVLPAPPSTYPKNFPPAVLDESARIGRRSNVARRITQDPNALAPANVYADRRERRPSRSKPTTANSAGAFVLRRPGAMLQPSLPFPGPAAGTNAEPPAPPPP